MLDKSGANKEYFKNRCSPSLQVSASSDGDSMSSLFSARGFELPHPNEKTLTCIYIYIYIDCQSREDHVTILALHHQEASSIYTSVSYNFWEGLEGGGGGGGGRDSQGPGK